MILRLVHLTVGLVLCAGVAASQTVVEQVTDQLQRQGFVIEDVERTWLGRIRVVARTSRYRRELVVVPTTGEILRDYLVEIDGGGRAVSPLLPRRSGGDDNAALGGFEREDEDDGEHDDDDEDPDDEDEEDDDQDDDDGEDDDDDDQDDDGEDDDDDE
ncbi:MAG: hypothetical protein AAGA32_07680 [Pseudomonadota bacterium]